MADLLQRLRTKIKGARGSYLPKKPKTLVMFDLSGTIVDDMETYHRNEGLLLLENGRVKTLEEGIEASKNDQFFKLLGDDAEKVDLELYKRLHAQIPNLRLFPESKRVLQRLREKGYMLAISSGHRKDYIDAVLQHFNLAKHFDVVHGDESGKKIEHVKKSIEQFKPEFVVFAGDIANDVKLAPEIQKSGFRNIVSMGRRGIFSRKFGENKLEEAGASQVISDLSSVMRPWGFGGQKLFNDVREWARAHGK